MSLSIRDPLACFGEKQLPSLCWRKGNCYQCDSVRIGSGAPLPKVREIQGIKFTAGSTCQVEMERSPTTGAEVSNMVPNQIAALVPTFDPSKDDLQVYSQKVMLLLDAWPVGKYTELTTRLILNCSGSAFMKLQLHQSELMENERKSVTRLIEILGGHWGQIGLEKKYEHAERALYKCVQKTDESADSFLAKCRHHVD